MKKIISPVAILSLVFLPVTPAFAVDYTISGSQTTQQNVVTGDTVTITGTGNLDVTGTNLAISGVAADGVTVTVQSGGNVEAQGADGARYDTIRLGDGANITVEATATATNKGEESQGANAQHVIEVGNSATIDISGTVTVEASGGLGNNNHGNGIAAGATANITISGTGSITSETLGGKAIDVGANSTVTNAGTLVSKALEYNDDRWGVVGSEAAGSGITLNNTGTIEHTNDDNKNFTAGVAFSGSDCTINNSGTINNDNKTTEKSVNFGHDGAGTGNALNLYGASTLIGFIDNSGAAGGATINFGYNGSAADASANTILTGNITGATWNSRVWGGTSIVTGTSNFNTLQVDSESILDLRGASTIAELSGAGTIKNDGSSDVALTVGNANSTTFSGVFEDGATNDIALTKQGSGTLTLSGENTYSGTTTISAGVLNIQNGTALGDISAGTSVSSGAALQLQGDIWSSEEELTLNGTGISNDGALRNISGYNTYNGAIILSGATRINSDSDALMLNGGITGAYDLTFGGSGDTYISSGVIGTGTGALTKDGSGTLDLSGVNTYTGDTTVTGGTLEMEFSEEAEEDGIISSDSALVLGGGRLYAWTSTSSGNSYDQSFNGLTLQSGASTVSLTIFSDDPLTLDLGDISREAGATVDFSSGGTILTTAENNASGILGAWATIFSAEWAAQIDGEIGTYGDSYDIDATAGGGGSEHGAVIPNTLLANVRIVYAGGDAGDITLAAADTTISTLLQSSNTVAIVDMAGKTLRVSGIMIGNDASGLTIGTVAGEGTLTAATSGGELIFINYSENDLTINSAIENNGAASSLTKSGTDTLILNGTNTYSGTTTISEGTLQIGDSGATGSLSTSSAITNNGTLSFNRTNTITQGTDFASVIDGSGGVTQEGSGTLVLNGANTYTGATTVSAGTLIVNGDNHTSSLTTVNSGATLEGSGTTGALTVNGTLSPGNSPGTLSSIGTVTYASGGTYTWEIDDATGVKGTNWDWHDITGGLTISSDVGTEFLIDITGTAANFSDTTNYAWTIATASSGITGFSTNKFTLSTTGFTNPFTGTFSIATSDNDLQVIYTMAALSTAYWTDGEETLLWNTQSGEDTTNWDTTQSGGIDAGAIPTTTTDVYFYADSASNFTTTLGEDFTIKSLNLVGGTQTSAVSIAAGNTLTINAGGITINSGAGALTMNNGVTLGASQTWLNNSSNTLTVAGNITNAANTLTIDGSGNATFSGILGGGAGGLTKTGAGTLTLSGENTYTGGTNLNSGILNFSSGALGGSGTVDFSGNATLQWASGNTQDVSSRIKIEDGFTATLDTQENNVTLASALQVGVLGTGGLTKNGTGQLTVQSTNSFSGTTTVNAGTLALNVNGGSATLGTSNVVIGDGTGGVGADILLLYFSNQISDTASLTINSSGQFQMNQQAETLGSLAMTGGDVNTANVSALTLGGDVTTYADASSATISGTGTLNLGGAVRTFTIADGAAANDMSISAVISNGGLAKEGPGVLVFTGANTYTGATTVSAGTLALSGAGSIADTSAVNVAVSDAIFDLSAITAAGETLGSLNGVSGSSVVLGSKNLITGDLDTTDSYGGVISGTGGALTKTGSGIFTLTGANTYTGTTTISSGTLQIGAGGTTGTLGAGAVTNNATLEFDRSDDITVANVISGTGTLVKQGAGTLTLAPVISATGGTITTDGDYNIHTFTNDGTFDVAGDSNAAVLVVAGGGGGGGAAGWVGSSGGGGAGGYIYDASKAITSGSYTVTVGDGGAGGAKAGAPTGFGTNGDDSSIFDLTAAGGGGGGTAKDGVGKDGGSGGGGAYSSTVDPVSGGASFPVTDPVQGYAGGSGKAAGASPYGAGGGGGSSAVGVSGDSGATGGAGTSNSITGAAVFYAGGGGGGNEGGGGSAGGVGGGGAGASNGDGTNGTDNTGGGGGGAAGTWGGVGGDGGSGIVIVRYDRTAIVGNTYTGGTTITEGIINFSNGGLGSSGDIVFNGGGLQYAAGNTQDVSSRITNSTGAIAIDTNSNDVTFAGALGSLNTGGLTKTGGGTLTLSGTNTYTGTTSIDEGILVAASSNALGNVSGDVEVAYGAELHLDGSVAVGEKALTIDGYGDDAALWSVNGNNSWAGTITLLDSGDGAWVGANTGSTLTLSGNITGENTDDNYLGVWGAGTTIISGDIITTDGYGLDKDDEGVLTLSGDNTYSGDTELEEGTLNINSATALGNGDGTFYASSGTTIDNTSGNDITLTNDNTQAWESDFIFTGTNNLNLGTGDVDMSNDDMLITVAANTLTLGGQISDDGSGCSLTKAGAGTLVLDASNTYTGTTAISDGILYLGASQTTTPFNFTGDAQLTLADEVDVTGDMTTDQDEWGTLTLEGSSTVTGQIGSYDEEKYLSSIHVTQAEGSHYVADFEGEVCIWALVFDGEDVSAGNDTTVNFRQYADLWPADEDPAITTETDGVGIVNFYADADVESWIGEEGAALAELNVIGGAGTTVTVYGEIYADTINVGSGATLDVSDYGDITLASGQTLMGSGTVTGDLTVGDTGTLSPGNSPGTLTSDGNVTYAGGGTYTWEINDAEGSEGDNPGWDFHDITGTLDIASDSETPFIIDITSLDGSESGPAANFDSGTSYSWTIARAAEGIDSFAADAFTLSLEHFTNDYDGTFSIDTDECDLLVIYTAGAADAYWKGGEDSLWNTDNSGNTNWTTDGTGETDLGEVPGATSDVYFTVNDSADNFTTALGEDFSIKGLTFTGTGTGAAANSVAINGGGDYKLTLGVNGITVEEGSAAHRINCDVVLGAAQSWANNSESLFRVAGDIDNGGNTLTVAGDGDMTLSGEISGAGALTKNGTGTLTLSGDNTYAGVTTLHEGMLTLDSAHSGTTYVTGAATMNVNEDLTGNIFFLGGGDGTVNLAIDKSILGIVQQEDGGSGYLGTVNFLGGDQRVTGEFGGTQIKEANVYDGTVTFSISVKATSFNFLGDATVNFGNWSTNVGDFDNLTGSPAGTFVFFDGGGATLNGNIGSTTALKEIIATADGQTVDLNGDVNVETLTFAGDGIVQIGGTANLGTVSNTSGTNDSGTLTFLGDATVTGQAGAQAAYLRSINVSNDSNTINFSGDVFTNFLNFDEGGDSSEVTFGGNAFLYQDVTTGSDGLGIVNFNGNATVNGVVGASDAMVSEVNFNSGLASINKAIYSNDVSVTGSATLGLSSNFETNEGEMGGNLTLQDTATLDVVGNSLAVAGDYAQGAGTTLQLGIATATTGGGVVVAGTTTVSGDSKISVNVPTGVSIASGTPFTIITVSGGIDDITAPAVTSNTRRYAFTASVDGATGDLILTSSGGSYVAPSGATGNESSVGNALNSITNPTGDMGNVMDQLGTLSDSAYDQALDTMHPDVSSGAADGSRGLTTQGLTMIANRLGGARSGGTTGSGVSSGDRLDGVGVWMQGLGSNMKQGERKGIEGYSANLFGTTVGADKVLDKHFRVGFAGSYGWARVKSKQSGSPSDDINSYQATLYGSFDSLDLNKARQHGKRSYEAVRSQVENSWYVDGMLAFTQNNYDSRREIWLSPTNKRVAKAEHYGQQYSTNFEAGYKFVFEKTKNLEVTPFASIGYNYLYMNKYKEKGANALNLSVDGQGFHQLEQRLGAKLAYPIVAKNVGTFIPSAKAAWLFDYMQDRFETTASFAGGGASFNTQGAKPARNGMLFGAELAFLNKGNVTVTGNWDLELKDQYMSNTYYGTVRYDF